MEAWRRKALVDMAKVKRGEYYYLGSNLHVKNERAYYAKGGNIVLQMLGARVAMERRKKLVQMKLLLHLLMQGRPMTDYVFSQKRFVNLNVSYLPSKHWSEWAGWQIVEMKGRLSVKRLGPIWPRLTTPLLQQMRQLLSMALLGFLCIFMYAKISCEFPFS
jgi:hypothetical protein